MKKYTSIFYFFASVLFACNPSQNSNNAAIDESDTASSIPAPATIIFTVVDTIHHDKDAFTEGFEYYRGKLVESTGEYGKTSIRIYNPASGAVEQVIKNKDKSIFGEGITHLKGKLYQLTYREHKVFVYDEHNLQQPLKVLTWPKEGWGLTNDGTNLLLSDGTSTLYYIKPDDFTVIRTLSVNSNEGLLDQLNELEFIDGYIYANRWHDDTIYKIDPQTGYVVGRMHFEGMLAHYLPNIIRGEEDVLNGVAWDDQEKMMYVTGKNWPIQFKVKL